MINKMCDTLLENKLLKTRQVRERLAMISGRGVLIRHKESKGELYDLKTDPQERINLAEIEKMRAGAMKHLIMQKIVKGNDQK